GPSDRSWMSSGPAGAICSTLVERTPPSPPHWTVLIQALPSKGRLRRRRAGEFLPPGPAPLLVRRALAATSPRTNSAQPAWAPGEAAEFTPSSQNLALFHQLGHSSKRETADGRRSRFLLSCVARRRRPSFSPLGTPFAKVTGSIPSEARPARPG